jgi:hypothetical protein
MKINLIFFAAIITLIALIPFCTANIDIYPYEDTVINIYNNTCIESSNWLYVYYYNSTEININDSIMVFEIKELNNKSVYAEIKISNF